MMYTWVKTHNDIVEYLKDKRERQGELIELLKKAGVDSFNDKDEHGQNFELNEIDPFTFFCYIYKHGNKKRLEILQKIAVEIASFPIPTDESGIPSTNAMKVWLFPYKGNRVNNEINRLWDFFEKVLSNGIDELSFADVLKNDGVGKAKLTEVLFYVKPETYFPIDTPTKRYISTELNLEHDFNTFDEYKNVLKNLKAKVDIPFYQISFDAWVWNRTLRTDRNYWRIGTQDGNNSYWPTMLDNGIISIGWSSLGDLEAANVQTKTDVQNLMRQKKEYSDDKKNVLSRKAGEVFSFFKDVNEGDVILAQNGAKILGIGYINGTYFYDEKAHFAHCKPVDWIVFEPGLLNKSGKLTSVHKISDKIILVEVDKLLKNSKTNNSTDMSQTAMSFPLNQILYGPPGTGKTYHTINKALSIIENTTEEKLEKEDRIALKSRFDGYVTEGSIVFSTFHQSMSYEDFIEGIKPIEPENEGDIMIYKVVDGIFKRISTDACFAIAQQKMPIKTKEVIDFSTQYDNYIASVDELFLQGKTVKVGTRSKAEIFIDGISPNQNITVKHSEGVRTYIVSKERLTKLNQAFSELDDVTNIDAQFREVIGGSNASAYWAILNAIRKAPLNEKAEIQKIYTYEEKKTVVASMLKSDFKYETKDKQAQPYVLIIDEINRGNVSQIFGELITLIEEDKRLGKDEALEVTLPYSKTPFGVPSNVYIIGTMNTADRSVEALDTALRRRFSFEEMPPQYNLPELATEINDVKLSSILKTINDRIEVLLNKDNLIGHSYFLKVDSEKKLKDTIFKNILPLLQEYFFGDYGKIGLVMGKGFVKEEKERKKVSFSAFDYPDTEGVQKTIYELRKYDDVNDIKEAIKLLLNGNEA
jgi:Cdc6-like AAA superfamily ATPase